MCVLCVVFVLIVLVNINLCHIVLLSLSLPLHYLSSSPISLYSVPPSPSSHPNSLSLLSPSSYPLPLSPSSHPLLTPFLPLPLAALSMPLVKSLRLGLGITVGASKKSSDHGTGTVTNSSDHENASACTPMQMSRSSKIQPMNSPSPCEVEHSEHE
jgi:hypothetical protein